MKEDLYCIQFGFSKQNEMKLMSRRNTNPITHGRLDQFPSFSLWRAYSSFDLFLRSVSFDYSVSRAADRIHGTQSQSRKALEKTLNSLSLSFSFLKWYFFSSPLLQQLPQGNRLNSSKGSRSRAALATVVELQGFTALSYIIGLPSFCSLYRSGLSPDSPSLPLLLLQSYGISSQEGPKQWNSNVCSKHEWTGQYIVYKVISRTYLQALKPES